MIAQPFDYLAPSRLQEALDALKSWGAEAMVLGGGTVLVSRMNTGQFNPRAVIDLRHLGLNQVEDLGDALVFGAAATYNRLLNSPIVAVKLPLLAELSRGITGGPQLRNQATIGGAACFANPSSDIPACLVALGAQMQIISTGGSRQVPVLEFFQGPFKTCMKSGEMLARIRLPRMEPIIGWAYKKLKISESSRPLVSVSCLVVRTDAAGLRLRIGIGGATPTPRFIDWNASDLIGLDQYVAGVVTADEWSDELAGRGYRRATAPPMVRRAALAALQRAGAMP